MKIVFLGTPQFSVPILTALSRKYEVVLVVSQPNRERKKGKLLDTPVKKCADDLGLTVVQPEKIITILPLVERLKPDVLVSAAYGQYVPSKILNLFSKTLNVHGSLLPKYRGGAPIQRAVMNGESETGITIIEMAKKMDAGRMYAQRSCPISDKDTADVLFERLSELGRDLLLETIDDVFSEVNVGVAQNEEEATYANNLDSSEEKLDFHQDAFTVVRKIHGLSSHPGAYFEAAGIKVKVFRAEVVPDDSDDPAGTVLSLKKRVLIKTGKDAISLLELQIPGKKVLTDVDFVNGQKILKENDVIS